MALYFFWLQLLVSNLISTHRLYIFNEYLQAKRRFPICKSSCRDGSKDGEHGLAGYGGVFRDEESSWIKDFMGQIGHSTILEAELWAIYRGLVISYEDNRRNVLIESDSLDANNMIRGPLLDHFHYTHLVRDIRGLIQRTNSELSHIPRESNAVADAIARMGRNQNETLVIIDNPPAQIASLLIRDIICNRRM